MFQEKYIYSIALDFHFKLRHACLCNIQISIPLITNHLPSIAFMTDIRSSKALSEFYGFTSLSPKRFPILPLQSPIKNAGLCQKSVNFNPFIFPYLELLSYIIQSFLFIHLISSITFYEIVSICEIHICLYRNKEADCTHVHVLMSPDPFLPLQPALFTLWHSNRQVPSSLV